MNPRPQALPPREEHSDLILNAAQHMLGAIQEQFELLAIGAHGSDWELAALTDATIRENLCGPLVARGYTPERVYTMSLNDLRASAIQHELIP
jgi:hypothetical protein